MAPYDWPVDTVNLPVMRIVTPRNVDMCGIYGMSFAYYSIKERLPVILTKIIDYLSRQGAKVKSSNGASDEDIQGYMQYITKLKNEIITNKTYDLLKVDTPEAKKWNGWIENLENKHYFTNVWVFTECYVYRRLREGCELSKGLKNFDPFEDQKQKSFASSIEIMCIVAERLLTMLPESDKDKRKADFMTLLKICLWANKCDLSLSMGEQVSLTSKSVNIGSPTPSVTSEMAQKTQDNQPLPEPVDPFQLIVDYKDKLLVDDSGKAADQVIARAESIAKSIEGNTTFKYKCSCHRLATLAGIPICKEEPPSTPASVKGSPKGSPPPTPAPPVEDGEEAPQIPCPTKMTIPQATIFDMVCDNAGYELFADLCLAHFLISQKIVQKIRFHVKKMPWFVSDVTERDFKYVIDSCTRVNFSREIPQEPVPSEVEGETPEVPPPRVINSDALRQVAEQWVKYVEDGTFIVMFDDYWTYPHVYRDMKKYDPDLYRKLQYAVAILFKGDLNYRKLLGERNVNPVTAFEPCLQGFIPAPIIAVRTVKADLICGLPKGKWEQLTRTDDKWMQSGDYGVIQFSPKAEALKPSDRPCTDYGDLCRGVICPKREDI